MDKKLKYIISCSDEQVEALEGRLVLHGSSLVEYIKSVTSGSDMNELITRLLKKQFEKEAFIKSLLPYHQGKPTLEMLNYEALALQIEMISKMDKSSQSIIDF